MRKTFTPDAAAAAIDLAGSLFGEIADLAQRLDRECYYAPNGISTEDSRAAGEVERLELHANRLREAISLIGAMADAGARATTGERCNESLADWLVSPVARKAAEKLAKLGGKDAWA